MIRIYKGIPSLLSHRCIKEEQVTARYKRRINNHRLVDCEKMKIARVNRLHSIFALDPKRSIINDPLPGGAQN
jgi:hypothetical protein